MMIMINKGDAIQIINKDHHWFPCILVVDEVKSWGVTADLYIPNKNGVGIAPIRLATDTFAKIGESMVVYE